jgi:hypothetical protein
MNSFPSTICDESATTGNLLCGQPTPIKYTELNDLPGNTMRIFIVALVFASLSAAAVSVLLNKFQEPGYVAFTTSGARVGDPGHNLIGPG